MCKCDRTAIAKGSIAKVKSNGDNGHPCRHPRLTKIGLDTFLFVKISAVGCKSNNCIHFQIFGPNPKHLNTSKR